MKSSREGLAEFMLQPIKKNYISDNDLKVREGKKCLNRQMDGWKEKITRHRKMEGVMIVAQQWECHEILLATNTKIFLYHIFKMRKTIFNGIHFKLF